MYPNQELIRLDSHKTAIRLRIARRRHACAADAGRVLQPLAWADRLVALVRNLSPLAALAAVPLGFLFRRAAAPRASVLGTVLRWGPVVFGAVRSLAAVRRR
ncbi:hypothetical protein [Ancylobacter sp.]|uniref:hypothetical protein n=1 Tax=Ancylobacter sp. TaxID=1872567 RepID=UPI003C7D8555